jgi:excinuclease ABC subunit C
MSFDIHQYEIPTRSGCYLYKDAKGTVIYVGKAKHLKNRVMSYFSKSSLDPKTKLLVSKIRDVEFITTNNEVEALLLEQSMIHKYSPKFNIDLKGTIRYAYIKLTDETYPRLVTSRKINDKGVYYGPYTDGTSRRQIMGALIKLFKIRTCVKLPKKVCLQYHLGNCQGPCEDHISHEEYMVNIKNAEKILKGDSKGMSEEIRDRMRAASQRKEYEIAKMYRDQLDALELVSQRQTIDQAKAQDQDVINWLVKDGKIYIQVFNIVQGVITSRHKFEIDAREGVVEEFIKQYYSIHTIPQEIILPTRIDDQDHIEEYLRETKKIKFVLQYAPKVSFTVAQKGIKKELLDLVSQNLEISMGLEPGILELQKKLQLDLQPVTIDFFDISNLKNQYIVGACIRLVNGQYHKQAYRKFRIRSKDTQDDFAAMQEVVYRRYADALKKGEELPDLICIDGGRGQLNAAVQALGRLELQTELCSLAKREEEIYRVGRPAPIKLNKKLPGIQILIKGRDEVHRFVLAYNRKLRKEIFK